MNTKQILGINLEKEYSFKIHADGIPVLISPLLLREIGAGQIDIANFDLKKQIVNIYEVKSKNILSFKQKKRLIRASEFLSQALDSNVCAYLLVKEGKFHLKFKIL